MAVIKELGEGNELNGASWTTDLDPSTLAFKATLAAFVVSSLLPRLLYDASCLQG